ncbi:hypothetical protein KB206_10235 [Microvirga sp. STS02]|uniref:DUF5682 family protein n=1 Tax=Hymenobacter negativus TaxID=2795026 RepID=UPI0018DBF2A8|nr:MULTISPECIES: DUF5682 family protein [Bacteria]MBH8569263.1 hypothetical protein [Hymenobacter negativus]MBR7208998.1 hypothetical protein [Microvirga sp. STS02]
MPTPDLRLFGIRHHGPGSAASLVAALDAFRPDIVLLECPADAEAALATATHPELRPPVALLVYNPKQQGQASFLPFAEFSPEWQAVQWCARNGAHVRCMDLPMSLRFGMRDTLTNASPPGPLSTGEGEPDELGIEPTADGEESSVSPPPPERGPGGEANAEVDTDPVAYIARLAGYTDSEQWWETHLEHAPGHADTFAVVLDMMTALREELKRPETEETLLREAFMRETLRATLAQGYPRVAVVCGAWHAPVLQAELFKKEDKARLKGLKKVATETTWIPWTYERLSFSSGYGAGVLSPAWYELLFAQPREEVLTHWMVQATRLLRGQDVDASSAHAIEGVRLAAALAAVRGLALPGIDELQEAAVAILGGGYAEPLALVHKALVIGVKLGEVPAGLPATPLQQDLAQQQKALRLKPASISKTLDLDLRQPAQLDRSHLLHRLRLLDINWGEPEEVAGKSGTFHEIWTLEWEPEMALAVIEAGRWGNTVVTAAAARATARAAEATSLEAVSQLLEEALRADLGQAIPALVARLETIGADTRDATHLLAALPPLAQVLRYGNVRRTDTTQVARVVQQLVPRLCIGLPAACTGLDYEAAKPLLAQIEATHQAIRLLQNDAHEADWYAALAAVQRNTATNGLLAGAAARLLFDAQQADAGATAVTLGLALAPAQPTDYATAWIEGFLRGSGLLLIHHRELFDLLDTWLGELNEDTFREVVPLLRRAFTDFSLPERRQILEIASTDTSASAVAEAEDFDWERGARVLPGLRVLLGSY